VYSVKDTSGYYSFNRVRDDFRNLPFATDAFTRPYAEGQMLKAGGRHTLMRATIPKAAKDSLVHPDSLDSWPPGVLRDSVMSNRSFVFCYCSVYEEDCDQVHLGADPPEADVCDF
jgi:hypothetical protein